MQLPSFLRRVILPAAALAAPFARADSGPVPAPVQQMAPVTVHAGPLGSIGIQCVVDVGGLFGGGRIKRMDISLVTPGSAAERAGIKAGDAILQVDAVDVTTYTVTQLRDALTREKGEEIVLGIRSPGAKGPRPVPLTLGARAPTPRPAASP